MKEELSFSIQRLTNALNSLAEGCKVAQSELEQDGVIQRFEFTFELLWKTLKIYLEEQGIICKSPKEALKGAFRIGLFSDERAFTSMLEDRNPVSHNYNKKVSERIFQSIRESYHTKMEEVLQKLLEKTQP